jgi:hypothetical protein
MAGGYSVFAKVSSAQKARIIAACQRNGHVVGFLGDGINDSAGLKGADVGISVDTAVDIAKESADIILLEKGGLCATAGRFNQPDDLGNQGQCDRTIRERRHFARPHIVSSGDI